MFRLGGRLIYAYSVFRRPSVHQQAEQTGGGYGDYDCGQHGEAAGCKEGDGGGNQFVRFVGGKVGSDDRNQHAAGGGIHDFGRPFAQGPVAEGEEADQAGAVGNAQHAEDD